MAVVAWHGPGTREVAAGKFKQQCLQLMDEVKTRRTAIVITKRGTPVARLVPMEETPAREAFGSMHGTVNYHGDIVAPDHEAWEID